jgi:hypothetical protein
MQNSMHGIVTSTPNVDANEFVMARNIAEKLHQQYPGHLWGVNITDAIIDVRNLALSGEWGFKLKVPAIYSASDLDRQAVTAGGEILERFRVRRGRANDEHIAALPIDFSGNHRPDL